MAQSDPLFKLCRSRSSPSLGRCLCVRVDLRASVRALAGLVRSSPGCLGGRNFRAAPPPVNHLQVEGKPSIAGSTTQEGGAQPNLRRAQVARAGKRHKHFSVSDPASSTAHSSCLWDGSRSTAAAHTASRVGASTWRRAWAWSPAWAALQADAFSECVSSNLPTALPNHTLT